MFPRQGQLAVSLLGQIMLNYFAFQGLLSLPGKKNEIQDLDAFRSSLQLQNSMIFRLQIYLFKLLNLPP